MARARSKTTAAAKRSPARAKPVAKKPVAKKPVAKKPAAKKPTATKPVAAKKSAAKKPVASKPVAAKPVAAKPVASKPVITPPVAVTRRVGQPPPLPAPKSKPSRVSLKMGAVVKILEAAKPITALRAFLATMKPGQLASLHDAQVALGAAQLILDPMTREHRGDPDAARVIDLVLARWSAFPDPAGYHAQELLKTALLAVGNDRERLARLASHVPVDASAELRLDMATAFAVAGERDSMLRALEAAMALGASPLGVTRSPDFATFHDDPTFRALLSRTIAPEIPVDVESHVDRVRAALGLLVETLDEIGDTADVRPAADLQAVLAAERAARISLPNEYRALLTLADGLSSGSCQLFGLDDIRGTTPLAKRARAYAASEPEVDACIPLAYIGRSTDWLFYDPAGSSRGGDPGFVVRFDQGSALSEDLVDALETAASMSRDQASVN